FFFRVAKTRLFAAILRFVGGKGELPQVTLGRSEDRDVKVQSSLGRNELNQNKDFGVFGRRITESERLVGNQFDLPDATPPVLELGLTKADTILVKPEHGLMLTSRDFVPV